MVVVVAIFTMIIVSMFKNETPRIETDYNGNPKEDYDDVHIKFGDMDKDFLNFLLS